MPDKRLKPEYQITNLGRALVAFFCVGVGISFGLVALGVGLAAFRGEAAAIAPRTESFKQPATPSLEARPADAIARLSEKVSALRGRPIDGSGNTASSNLVADGQPQRPMTALVTALLSSIRKGSPQESAKSEVLPPAKKSATDCEQALRDCADVCGDRGMLADATDLGLSDETEVCQAACADGRTRCEKAIGAARCGEFLGACRYRCYRDGFSDECEDGCDLGEAACRGLTDAVS